PAGPGPVLPGSGRGGGVEEAAAPQAPERPGGASAGRPVAGGTAPVVCPLLWTRFHRGADGNRGVGGRPAGGPGAGGGYPRGHGVPAGARLPPGGGGALQPAPGGGGSHGVRLGEAGPLPLP